MIRVALLTGLFLFGLHLTAIQVLGANAKWPQRYNAGVIAYRTNDFAQAASAFEQAIASPNRAVQERAFYNLGNANYRLGQTEASQAQLSWQRAVKYYEAALAIDPKDTDAKYNLEFVRKQLEQLQKQQQKQMQNNQPQEQNEEKQNQQPEQNQPQQQQQQQSDSGPNEEPKAQRQPQDQHGKQPQPANLDQQQAKALLDTVREDEQNWNFFPELQTKEAPEAGIPSKDW